MLKTLSLIDIAKESSADQHRIAAAVYDKRGRLISTGVNKPSRSHPRQAHYANRAGMPDRIYLHAELDALIRCRCDPWAIQIVRIGPKCYPKSSKPCPICRMAIEESGVKEIVYHDKNGEEQLEQI